jgi:hypothetical protein
MNYRPAILMNGDLVLSASKVPFSIKEMKDMTRPGTAPEGNFTENFPGLQRAGDNPSEPSATAANQRKDAERTGKKQVRRWGLSIGDVDPDPTKTPLLYRGVFESTR